MTGRRAIGLLIALHLAIVLVVQPRGQFPINDDWAFAQSVQWLLAEHRVRLSDWVAMNLLPQTLGGGLVTALFGFSFEALRHLTQGVALLTSFAAYGWFRAARLAEWDALVATLGVVAFPLWPILANSYMTDLYGLAFALPSAALFLRSLESPRPATLVAATALAAAGVLQRQVVLVVPFAFMAAWLFSRRDWTVRAVATGIAPFLVALGAELAYHAYLVGGPGVPEAQQLAHGRVAPMIVDTLTNKDRHRDWVLVNIATLCGYFGLFVVGWASWWGLRGASTRTRAAIAAGGVAIAAIAFAAQWFPPYRANMVLDPAGIGPFTLYDAFAHGTSLDREPGIFWRLAALAGAFGAAALAALLLANLRYLASAGRGAASDRVFVIVLLAAYLFPFTVVDYIDRYFVFVLPFLFVLWARTWPAPAPASRGARVRHAAAVAWLLAVIALSSVATRDYFAWNRARWDAIRTAERMGATPDEIDGGFEYNGFKRFESLPRAATPGKSWWWVKDDRYVVAFVPIPGYEEIAAFPVRHWLPRTPPVVRLLRRI